MRFINGYKNKCLLPKLALLALLGLGLAWGPAWPALGAPLTMPENIPEKPGDSELAAIVKHLTQQHDQVINIQRELVSRPTICPEDGGEGEDAKARWIEGWLRDNCLPRAERFDLPDERVPSRVRPNLVIHYPGISSRTLWIIGHLDTSPAGDLAQWTGSPWFLRVEGDLIYGRGVEDNHQAISSGLLLLQSLARQKARPPLSLGLIFISGEKYSVFANNGIVELANRQPNIFKPDDLFVVNDFGNEHGSLVEIGEKGILWLKFTVSGQQTHSAYPNQGSNSLEAAANLIIDLKKLYHLFPMENNLFVPATSTFEVTKVETVSSPINMTLGEFSFYMDARLLAPYTPEEVYEAALNLAHQTEAGYGVKVEVQTIVSFPPAPVTDLEAPVIKILSRAVEAQLKTGLKAEGTGGVTLASSLRRQGLQVAVWARSASMATKANECISIQSLIETAQVFANMLYIPQAPEDHHPGATNADSKL